MNAFHPSRPQERIAFMKTLRRLIAEAHGCSLWQVFTTYVAVSRGAHQIIRALPGLIGLPLGAGHEKRQESETQPHIGRNSSLSSSTNGSAAPMGCQVMRSAMRSASFLPAANRQTQTTRSSGSTTQYSGTPKSP